MFVSVIIAAAGKGSRMGDIKKQFLDLNGMPVIAHSIRRFHLLETVFEIILVASKEDMPLCRDIVKKYGFSKVSSVVQGGGSRCESVANGLKAVSSRCDIVAVHDAARPLVKEKDITSVIDEAWLSGAAVLAVNPKDTIKLSDSENNVVDTPERNRLWQVQTPQAFKYSLMREAYASAENSFGNFTDDASILESFGVNVKLVSGSYDNIKITTPEDMQIAMILSKEDSSDKIKKVTLYTDGACSGNPGKGGYGAVLIYNGTRKEISGGYKETTNNRMEIMAVLKGLEALKEPCEVLVISDSKYVVDAFNKGWIFSWKRNNWTRSNKDKVLNIDLWEKLLEVSSIHKVSFEWVKGHAQNIENERCDELARNAILYENLYDDSIF